MPPAGFEPTIPASERLQNHALERPATGVGQTQTFVCVNQYEMRLCTFRSVQGDKLFIYFILIHLVVSNYIDKETNKRKKKLRV